MLKLILTALTTASGLPLKKNQFNSLNRQTETFIRRVTTLFVSYLFDICSDFIHLFKFLTISKPRKRLLRLRLAAVILLGSLYFFFGPSTLVNANLTEKVIPEQTSSAVVTIKESVTVEAAPVFTTPVRGYVSTYFSSYHRGVDIPNPKGAPVKAFADGEVTFAGWANGGFGNLVVIKHKLGYVSQYAHLSRIDVKVGQNVASGMVVGGVGSTGNSTGSHLHFEIYLDYYPVNPLNYISPTN